MNDVVLCNPRTDIITWHGMGYYSSFAELFALTELINNLLNIQLTHNIKRK